MSEQKDDSEVVIELPLTDVYGPDLKPYTTEAVINDHFIPEDEESTGVVRIKVGEKIRIESSACFDNDRVIAKVRDYLSHDNVFRETGQEFARARFERATQNTIPSTVAIMMIQQNNGDLLTKASEDQLQRIGHGLKAIDEDIPQSPTIQMSMPFFDDVASAIKEERQLTQLMGVALRGVLPYAENEVFALAGAFQKDGDESIREEYERGSEKVSRAHQALNILNSSSLSIEGLSDDAFDDSFQIKFEDDGDD